MGGRGTEGLPAPPRPPTSASSGGSEGRLNTLNKAPQGTPGILFYLGLLFLGAPGSRSPPRGEKATPRASPALRVTRARQGQSELAQQRPTHLPPSLRKGARAGPGQSAARGGGEAA